MTANYKSGLAPVDGNSFDTNEPKGEGGLYYNWLVISFT